MPRCQPSIYREAWPSAHQTSTWRRVGQIVSAVVASGWRKRWYRRRWHHAGRALAWRAYLFQAVAMACRRSPGGCAAATLPTVPGRRLDPHRHRTVLQFRAQQPGWAVQLHTRRGVWSQQGLRRWWVDSAARSHPSGALAQRNVVFLGRASTLRIFRRSASSSSSRDVVRVLGLLPSAPALGTRRSPPGVACQGLGSFLQGWRQGPD